MQNLWKMGLLRADIVTVARSGQFETVYTLGLSLAVEDNVLQLQNPFQGSFARQPE